VVDIVIMSQILLKEVVHHFEDKDRVGIFRGMHECVSLSSQSSKDHQKDDETIPSILIITRPQVDIDYPLWDQARQVWKDNQPSVEQFADELQQAGFGRIQHSLESYPCHIALSRWQTMIKNRFWSTFSSFSDEELQQACEQIAIDYQDRLDEQGILHFEDRLVFLTAHCLR
jgi:hypothetical protein